MHDDTPKFVRPSVNTSYDNSNLHDFVLPELRDFNWDIEKKEMFVCCTITGPHIPLNEYVHGV